MNILFLLVGLMLGGIGAWFMSKFYFKSNSLLRSEVEEKYVRTSLYEEKKQEAQEQLQLASDLNAKLLVAEDKVNSLKSEIEKVQESFRNEFKNLANDLFEEKSKRFTLINEEKIGNILNPLKERIKDFEKKVEDSYNSETREKAGLKEVIKKIIETNQQMSDEAQRLTQALKGDSKTQGDWGEIQLERLLEKTGLLPDIHYKKQENFKTEEGANVRPDYVIYLPENKHLVIDSKVSLTAYERYFNGETDEERMLNLKNHITSISKHINDLGSKNYQNLYGINSPDYVFLFVALEPALTIALQNDLSLFDKALGKNIVLVSASTLLATMRTISFIWKQENQNKNAQQIAKESGALYDKFCGFMGDLKSLGKQLDDAKHDYNESMKKLYNSPRKGDTIIGRIERIKDLGARTSKQLPPELVDQIE